MMLTEEEYQKAKTAIYEQQQKKDCPGDILDALERAGFELVNSPPATSGEE